jgi:NuA3 HAT complex component NTO1
MSRKRIPLSAQKLGDGTPTARRRPAQFHHGYRPGGAGGGGRYIDPITGEEIPAAIFREMLKSAGKGGIGGSLRRPPPPPPPAPPAVGPDGVYKPREERSYTEFHPGFDAEQPLLAYSAQEIDGDDYQPLSLVDNKSVKAVNVKEEDEMRGESGTISITDETDITMLNGNDAEEHDQQRVGFQHNDSIDRPASGTAASPVSPASNGVSIATEADYSSVATDTNGVGRLSSFQMSSNNSAVNDLPIDPTLAALTPPPPASIDSASSLPIDPALVSDESGPGQTQTPAATPTDGSGKEEKAVLAPTPPPMTPAGPGVGVSPQKRASNDVPTLASLRSHRTTAGKPPPRSMPPSTARRPRSQNQKPHEELNLRAPSFREIRPFKFAWSSEVGSKGPRGLNNPQTSNDAEPMSDKMLAVGYQQSSEFKCPDTLFRDHPDVGIDEELGSTDVELVEYDMDEQDDKWLTNYNSRRLMNSDTTISREIFELVMTKIEKAWVNLERKMPKVQAKPHGIGLPNRRRSSGRAGDDEDDDGAEDSKCAICDDGECENANAIVFCDGCNLAVHQECYGVPYIPEGQWHCRKCQQIPRQIAVCYTSWCCTTTDAT